MSAWNKFTSAISGIPVIGKRITGGGAYLSDEELKKEAALSDTLKSALAELDIASNPIAGAAKDVTKQAADFLLRGAVQLNNKVISPYITRPAATLGLLTDIQSPLYKKGQYEEGFQFSDIKAAYNRSAKVSTFQALTKSELTPISMLSSMILPAGGIDMAKVDLWNDESIKQNFVDNAVGRWYTGIGDFVVGNKVFGIAGKVTGAAVKGAAKPVGLYTKGKTVENLAGDMQEGIAYAKTAGTQGRQTVSGSHMVTLAETRDWGTVEDLVTKYSTNEKLIPLIREASDADAVKDIILADKGDLFALQRLAETDSHKLFIAGNVQAQLQNKFIQTGQVYLPEGPSVPRLQKAFDDAINADPQFKKLKDAFFDEDYSLTPGGKAYMPLEPIVGAGLVVSAQGKIRGAKAAVRSRFADAPESFKGFAETTLGSNATGLAMRLVRLIGRGTESLPTGYVSFSGMRPLQARTELNGFLNNMKLFRDGAAKLETAPNQYEKVSDIRTRLENIYMSSLGEGPAAQVAALKAVDAEVGKLLAYKVGIYNQAEIDAYVNTYQNNVSRGIQSVQQNGFGIGHDGSAILVQPQTVRQLAESYRFTPWDDIEKQIEAAQRAGTVKGKAVGGQQLGREVFQQLNRVWTFDVLARPAYALKQSMFEPMISTGLAYGLDFVWNDVVKTAGAGGARNAANWVRGIKVKAKDKKEFAAVNKALKDKATAYEKALQLKEIAEASVNELLTTASPATKAQHLSAATKELQAASKMLDNIELDLRTAAVPYGKTAAIPSIVTLERRVAYLESKPAGAAKAAEIADAKIAIANYRAAIGKLATNKKVIQDADKAVQDAYDNIDKVVSELGDAAKRQADVHGKTADFKKRYYTKEVQHRVVNGQHVAIDSFIQDPTTPGVNYFTAATRAEVQNARTSDINYLGELSIGSRKAAIQRKMPLSKIGVSDEFYFEELAYLANRQYRGDELMDLILRETPMDELKRWAATDTGRDYLRQFDVFDAKEVPSYLADKVALVQRTFPSYEARAAIVKGEVTSQQLQKSLAPYANELYDITPAHHNYAGSAFGTSNLSKANTAINEFVAKRFRELASFENPIRYAAFDKEAIDAVARKAEYLMSQGVEMTPARINALRQSAGREALENLEKTLYTINNPNRFINSLRLITAFPAANANAFLRYGRLAAKSPQRAAGFMYNYGRTFQTFGVDENGNPTNDINKITHLVVPGTKDLGIGPGGQIALSAQSLGFLLNRPSPSFISSLAIGNVMKTFPQSEDEIENFMTINGVNWFKVYFPYGAPTNVGKAFVPPWLNSFYNGVMGPEGKQDYLSSWKSVYNYHAMLNEMGVTDGMPTDDQIRQEVKALWLTKAFASFSSPFAGIPFKVDTNPMGLTTNLYYKLQEKYAAQGMSNQDARDAAGEEMLSLLGPKFMVDRVSFTGSSKNLNIPATYEAYQRIFKDNADLVGRLANIEPGEIGLIGLIASDLSRDPAEQSSNILNILSGPGLVIPGTSKRVNELKLTPEEIEVERIKQRTWNQYTAVREALEAKITDGQTLRGHPELKAALDKVVEGPLKEASQAWYDEFQFSASGDASYKYARALQEITSDKNFMKSQGGSTFWKDAKDFLDSRAMFTDIYQALPDYDPRKALLKEGYNYWVQQNLGQWDGNLKTIVMRYFDNDSLKAVN